MRLNTFVGDYVCMCSKYLSNYLFFYAYAIVCCLLYAYAYFARHFGYEVIGAIQPQSFEEPSPSDIAALIDQVKSKKVKAVFGSEVFPSPVLEQIGKETGVRYVDVLRDDDLPGAPGETEHSWAGLMKFDYITIVEALGGDASALKTVNVKVSATDKANYPQ